jgi:RHS repeat-associated protein
MYLRTVRGETRNLSLRSSATGLYFLRARYYGPSWGRFLSKDPFPGFLAAPITLHRYLYAYNNPSRFNDPSGNLGGVDDIVFLGVGAISGIVGQWTNDQLTGESHGLGVYVGQAIAGAITAELIGNCAELVVCIAVESVVGSEAAYLVGAGSKHESFSPCQAATAAFGGIVGGAGADAGVPDTLSTNVVGSVLGSFLDVTTQASAGCLGAPQTNEGAPPTK